MKMEANSGDNDKNAAVCCTKAHNEIREWIYPLSYKWLHRFSTQRLFVYEERKAAVPPRRALGDFYGMVIKRERSLCFRSCRCGKD